MEKSPVLFVFLLIAACLAIQPAAVVAQSADAPVVQAILFHTPTCPACIRVIEDVLDPMMNDHGDQLQVVKINTLEDSGYEFYLAVVERYQIPSDRQGVPTLLVGDTVLIGSSEISERFPPLFDDVLDTGGISWPDIPGLVQTISEFQTPPSDPVGFAVAGVVLGGMVVALGYTAWRVGTARQHLSRLLKPGPRPLPAIKTRAIPFLGAVGLGIATYLAFVEFTNNEAICGPIGECNFVQTSPYARILGIPVAVLGILYYLAVGALWMGQRYKDRRWGNQMALGLLGLTVFGTLFSTYLTGLELFAVRAVCLWCIGSAVTATALMLVVVLPITGIETSKANRR